VLDGADFLPSWNWGPEDKQMLRRSLRVCQDKMECSRIPSPNEEPRCARMQSCRNTVRMNRVRGVTFAVAIHYPVNESHGIGVGSKGLLALNRISLFDPILELQRPRRGEQNNVENY
jgi:hypothetical protein